MNDLISHRGPDEEGFFFDKNYGCGARRLSIIDIEKGSQPIIRGGGNIIIAYNGEVYNYREIKEELSAKGYKFSTNTDTETVLAAYECWGEDCLEKLNGIFAFAIYNAGKKEIFLARDRLGVKPLFYYKDKEKFVFGSELKAIIAHPSIDKKLNLTAVS
ncbi:MAG: asparagine synthetase B, partial [Elusimicrobiales bacterium]|nr:asparagine synthetase B [Elusimicrobiales bacterium]